MNEMRWLNEPPSWQRENGSLKVVTGDHTDFWRKTHYGFIRDNGHFFHKPVQSDFTAEVRFSGKYEKLYDQAGLMLRSDERTWIKVGVEYTDGQQHLSAVVTRDFSDWSVSPLEGAPEEVWLRLTKHGSAVRMQGSLDGVRYQLLRLAYFPPREVSIGVMCCSPQRAGFAVTFQDFNVGPALPDDLHV